MLRFQGKFHLDSLTAIFSDFKLKGGIIKRATCMCQLDIKYAWKIYFGRIEKMQEEKRKKEKERRRKKKERNKRKKEENKEKNLLDEWNQRQITRVPCKKMNTKIRIHIHDSSFYL